MRKAMAEAEVGDDVFLEGPDGRTTAGKKCGAVWKRSGSVYADRFDGKPDSGKTSHLSR